MPAYAYTGLNAKGKNVKGVETADSVNALKASLKRNGIFLTTVTETNAGAASNGGGGGGGGGGGKDVDIGKYFDRVNPKMVAG